MTGWRDLAQKVLASEGAAAPVSDLPDVIRIGVESMRWHNRRVRRADAWRQVAEDAARLIEDGWAQRALSLGWHPLDLFGCSADGGASFEGVAVWLGGGRLVLMDEQTAIAVDGERRRVFNRRVDRGPNVVFVWELGR